MEIGPVVIISIAFILQLSGLEILGNTQYCYDREFCGPASWEGSCQTGTNQSPIDIPAIRSPTEVRKLHLNPCYYETQDFILTNNGHSVQVSLRPDGTSNCIGGGTLLGDSYVFSQLHFHWGDEDKLGSEHTLNGEAFVMEGHVVQYNSKFANLSAALASGERRALSVLGFLYMISSDDNPGLKPIVDSMAGVGSANLKTNGSGLQLHEMFLLQSPTTVAQYEGSLTTPPCDEVVLWNLILEPNTLSNQQLIAFRTLLRDDNGKGLVNNYRPIQRLHGRVIQYFEVSSEPGEMSP